MKQINYTSGEKRGLIALLLILLCLVSIVFMVRQCQTDNKILLNVLTDGTQKNVSVITTDTLPDIKAKESTKRKKRNQTTNNIKQQDGIERNLRDERTDR